MGIIKPLIFLFIIWLGFRLVKGLLNTGANLPQKDRAAGLINEMVQDPLCGTYIPRNEAYREVIDGNELFFCSRECAGEYKQNKANSK